MYKLFGYSLIKELKLIKLLPSFLAYIGCLVIEIFKANFILIKFVAKGSKSTKPIVVHFHSHLKTSLANTLLANSITLTPGTITVSAVDDEFYVHCLDESLAEGIDDSVFVRRLKRMENRL